MARNAAQSAHNTKTCVSLAQAAYAVLDGLQERSGLSRSALLSALVLKEFYSGEDTAELVVENDYHRSERGVNCARVFAIASFIADNPQHSGLERTAAKITMAMCEIQWLTCGKGLDGYTADEDAAYDRIVAIYNDCYTGTYKMSPHVVNAYKHTLLARRDNLMLSDNTVTYLRLRGATVKATPHVNALVKRYIEQATLAQALQDSLRAADKE